MRKKWLLGVGVGCLVGVSVMGIGLTGIKMSAKPTDDFSKSKAAQLEMILQKYYMGNLNSEEMLDGVYKGYVYGLEDAGTRYLTKEEYAKESVAEDGEYLGTGIEFTWGITSQELVVTDVVPGSPADKAGIVAGDKIVAIDDIKAMMSNEVHIYEKLTYAGENPVKYTLTTNDGQPKGDVTLVADVVDRILVSSRMVKEDVGYIKIKSLPEGTVKEVEKALKDLKDEGAKKLVLDLRGTISNDLDEVKKLADLFVEEGNLFSVKGKDNKVTTYTATKNAEDIPLGIIVNQYTSGAIEGFVSAMKDLKRGIVVGEKTQGKGTIQQLIELQDGSGLYVTSQILIDGEGNMIKDEGVEPDVLVSIPTEDTLEIVTTGHITDESDTLLQKTIEVLK